MPRAIKVNLNQYARFKLTPLGMTAWRKQREVILARAREHSPTIAINIPERPTRLQLWEIFEAFGGFFNQAGDPPLEAMSIEIEMDDADRTLRHLLDDIYDAKARYHEAISRRFRKGVKVHVRHGDNIIAATVLRTANDRVMVRSATGKEYGVHAPRLVEHDEL